MIQYDNIDFFFMKKDDQPQRNLKKPQIQKRGSGITFKILKKMFMFPIYLLKVQFYLFLKFIKFLRFIKNFIFFSIITYKMPIQKKLQNTISIQKGQPNIAFYPLIENKKPIQKGLPNIGNTCFLNSVLQCLYSIDYIRQKLIKISQNNKQKQLNMNISEIIGQIFNTMGNNKSQRTLKQNLIFLLHKFSQNHQLYQKRQQYDALQTLLFLIHQICDQEQLEKMFSIRSSFKCSCLKNQLIKQSILLLSKKQSCSKCLEKLQISYLNSPKYLIMVNYNDQAPLQYQLKQCGRYELLSLVGYHGTGRAGHYRCIRKEQGILYSYSDNYVQQVPHLQDQTDKKMIIFYRRIQNYDDID